MQKSVMGDVKTHLGWAVVQEGFLEAVASKVRPEGCTMTGQVQQKEE